MSKLKRIIVNEIEDYKILLKNVPILTMIFFVLSVIYMNIFASKELLNVKYGTTISYKELAKRIGRPTSVRAVANAVGKNKIGII